MKRRLNIKNIGIFLGLFFIFAILIYSGSFSHVKASITDRLYGEKKILENIVIIKIDDESINKIGRWPWQRDVFAEVLDKTKEAKVIGMDLSFFEESENDFVLRQKLNSMDNVVLAAEINRGVLQANI